MAFDINNLQIFGTSKVWANHHYHTADRLAQVLDLDYFDAANHLRVGDKIDINCADCSVSLEVTEADQGRVTVGLWGQLPESVKRSLAA